MRKHTSKIAYSSSIVSGIIGIGLSCFFGFSDVSSKSIYNVAYILLGLLMAGLVAFGYRGIEKHRRLADEVWWHLLIALLIWLVFLAQLIVFIFTCIALSSGGQTVL